MRTFSLEERLIINTIINSDILKREGMILIDRFLEDFFGEHCNKSIYVNCESGKVYLSVNSEDKNICRKAIVETTILLHLLMELESNGFIVFIGNANTQSKAIGNQHGNGTTIELVSPLPELIKSKLGMYILPSESLKEMVLNNFKSAEQKRHNQTMWVAGLALTTSILFGLWGIFK